MMQFVIPKNASKEKIHKPCGLWTFSIVLYLLSKNPLSKGLRRAGNTTFFH